MLFRSHVRLGKHVSDHQHRFPSRLRSFPSALLPVHQQLHLQSPVCQATEVRRQHHPHRTHLWRGQVCLQVDRTSCDLVLNALKTVEMVVDFRKKAAPPAPITLCDSPVTAVESFRFLGTIVMCQAGCTCVILLPSCFSLLPVFCTANQQLIRTCLCTRV